MKVIIADDHPIFRSGLKFLLENSFSEIEVSAFENGQQVLENFSSIEPDLVLLDIDMPVLGGLDTCKMLINDRPDARIAILSMYKDMDFVQLAFANGAHGYLIKDNTAEELVECVETLLAGKTYVARDLRHALLNAKTRQNGQGIETLLANLTATEIKVLDLVSSKHSSRQIAEQLFVSTKSVENYRSRICKKLNLDAQNNALLMWAVEHRKLIESFIR